jgi:hypothetical protein
VLVCPAACFKSNQSKLGETCKDVPQPTDKARVVNSSCTVIHCVRIRAVEVIIGNSPLHNSKL